VRDMKFSMHGVIKHIQFQRLMARLCTAVHRGPLAFIALLVAIVAIGGLAACAGYTGAKTSTGQTGVLSGSAATLAFGNVGMGKTATQSFTVTNTGTAAVSMGQTSITGPGFTVVSGAIPASLGVGQNVTVQIQFAPQSSGSVTGGFAMVSNASNSPFSVALTGSGAQPGLASAPAAVSFGNVVMGSSGSASVSLSNTGSASVTISQASASGAGFTMSGSPAGQTIQPGQSITFTAQFSPTSVGSATGSISISSNAPNSPLSIALSGAGTQPGLASMPSAVTFGNVVMGSSGSALVNLSNTGSAGVTISQASVTGAGFTMSGSPAGQTIQPGQSISFTAKYSPTSVGSANGSISVSSNAPNSPLAIALSGAGTQPGLASTPSAVSFGNVGVGSSGAASVSLANTGSASVTISQANVTGAGFTMTGSPAGQTIQPGQSISFVTKFSPTSVGNASGNISISSDAPNSPMSIALNGTGTQPGLASTPSAVSFGSVVVGSSGTASVNLSNSGSANVTISQASTTGAGFTMTGSPAGQTIQPGQSISFTAQFSPTTAGSASGSISISSNAPNSPMTIALAGLGTQPGLAASPTAVNFKGVVVGNSGTASINLSNTGTAAVTVSQATASGAGFTIIGSPAGQTISPGQSIRFTAQFSPTSVGSASGSVSVASNAPNSPLTIALSGTGTQPQIAAIPSSAPFGSVTVGNSNSQTITVTNAGTANLVISQGAVTGSGFHISGLSAPLTIPAGSNATFNAVFTPTGAGTVTGSISLSSDAPNSPYVIGLSGTGVAGTQLLTFNVSSLSFGSVNVGSSSNLPATLTNTGNASVTISASNISGTGFTVSGISPGESLSPSQSLPVTVQFAPTVAGAVSGNLSLVSNATNSPAISLSGTGTQQVSHTVAVAWSASISSVIGYNVYRGTVTGGPYTTKLTASPVASTQFTDTGLQSGQTYYYVVTAVDASNVESADSGQATATIP
jgi:archaellum component FlaF (FlaF/FlaG flagellin family)